MHGPASASSDCDRRLTAWQSEHSVQLRTRCMGRKGLRSRETRFQVFTPRPVEQDGDTQGGSRQNAETRSTGTSHTGTCRLARSLCGNTHSRRVTITSETLGAGRTSRDFMSV